MVGTLFRVSEDQPGSASSLTTCPVCCCRCFPDWEDICKTLDLNSHLPKPPPEEKENKEDKKEKDEKEGDKEIEKEIEKVRRCACWRVV
jgi:hypothetical protein